MQNTQIKSNFMKKTFSPLLLLIFFSFYSFAFPGYNKYSILSFDGDSLRKIPANPGAGFNYPYLLYIPKEVNTESTILVVPNNTGTVNDTFSVHEEEAVELATRYRIGHKVAFNLKLPLLVPIFPRPLSDWKTYTHALNRKTILVDSGEMKRIDLQLLAMIEDARKKLESLGITTDEKVFLNGFSASGTFSNRFAFLHPEIIKAVASGGVNGICMLPFSELNGKTLNYPLGIADYHKITGYDFNFEKYKIIPQYIYMGEKDDNDATLFRDSYSEEESNIIYDVLGKLMMPDRFNQSKLLYEKANLVSVEFKVYSGIGHKVDSLIVNDVCEFFKRQLK